MTDSFCKLALCALGPLLITVPAVAADLVPYDNGYIPEPYGMAPPGAHAAYPAYGPAGMYGAEPRYCGPDSGPWPGSCVPGYPHPAAILPNGPAGPYSYPGEYQEGPPARGPSGGYGDQSDYPPAILPSDRYGDYSSQPGYGPSRTPPAVAPDDYSGQRGYGPDRTARYGGYPTQSGDHSPQPSYRQGSPPPPRPPATGENANPNGYGPDRGYPPQDGYGPDRLPAPTPGNYSQRDYDSGPAP
jgi:hypothetical protein